MTHLTQPPRLQAHGSCDFEEFTDIVFRLLNAAWGENWGTFCEAFPNGRDPNNVKLPVITYTLKEMIPGTVGNSGTREMGPRHRAFFDVPGADGEIDQAMELLGRMLDCEIVFEIWEENNTKASALAKRFMDFMDMYRGFIKSQGVKELFFKRYSNETESGEWRDNIVSRSLYYSLRLEHLIEAPVDVIKKVTGTVGTQNDPYRMTL